MKEHEAGDSSACDGHVAQRRSQVTFGEAEPTKLLVQRRVSPLATSRREEPALSICYKLESLISSITASLFLDTVFST